VRIGLFDSGVGGLTCLKSLLTTYPQHDYVYLGDTARLPYGTKSQSTIKNYALQNIRFLKDQNVDIVITACHSASSAVLNFNLKDSLPIYEVITPACSLISKETKTLGLIATPSTVASQIYDEALAKTNPDCQLVAQACPLLVPLVENGMTDDPITDAILARYLEPLITQRIEALILGCTHFPVLSEAIAKQIPKVVKLIDPGFALAKSLEPKLLDSAQGRGTIEAFVTDNGPQSVELARVLLGSEHKLSVQLAHL